MAGEHSYSQAAVQALCDCYYTQPGTRVEDIRNQAARGQLEYMPPDVDHTVSVPAELQREIAVISRAQCFELLRQDPRHTANPHRRVALFGDILVSEMERQLQRAAEAKFPNSAELVRLHKAYRELKADLDTPAPTSAGDESSLIATLTGSGAQTWT